MLGRSSQTDKASVTDIYPRLHAAPCSCPPACCQPLCCWRGAALTSDGRDGRQQADTDGQHQKAKQENCHLAHKASEGKGGGKNIPAALDKGVGSGPIVRLVEISIQAQIAKKKPYQMCAQGFGLGGWRGLGLARSACEPGLDGTARYLRQPLHFPLKWRPQPQQ